MPAYVRLQEREFAMERDGYSATRHQAEVGTGYFDKVSTIVSGGTASTLALVGSTEEAQFEIPATAYDREPIEDREAAAR
jgi:isocitrate lyase